jgi:hypothetical protein
MSQMVNIPAKIKNGQVVLRTNKPISIIKEGTHINLSVPKYRIIDENGKFYNGTPIKLFAGGEVLLVGIDYQDRSREKTEYLDKILDKYDLKNLNPIRYKKSFYVEIVTQHELLLRLNDFSKATLMSCQIKIPFLEENAGSVNHAYTLISTHFEKHRKSHTGNVFNMVFGKCKKQGWNSLDYYRDVAIDENATDNIDNSNPLFE